MKFWKHIPLLLAMLVASSACVENIEDGKIDENPDEAVKITYLGKGFQADKTFYGDLFRIEAEAGFTYDYLVMSKSTLLSKYGSLASFVYTYPSAMLKALAQQGRKLEEYLITGPGTFSYGILPEGKYTIIVIGIDMTGASSGVCYTKEFEVASYISCEMDGPLSPQADWKAEYLGRYQDQDTAGNPILCDRISSSGTGTALYYHVICPAGSIKTSEDLISAFRKGSGVDDLKGGEGVIEWYKMIAPSYNYLVGLDELLAKGGKDAPNGYMDYTLGTPSTGTFDVYTVEMLLNGHITGRYGKTTLEIDGTPNIKALGAVPASSRALRRACIKNEEKMR